MGSIFIVVEIGGRFGGKGSEVLNPKTSVHFIPISGA